MPHYISQESDVSTYPKTKFMTFYIEKFSTGYWKQANGADIFYGFVIHPNANKCIVVSQGRSESLVKYAEFIYELYQNGYTVFSFDHQGQGQSSRLLPNPHIGYVRNFNDYISDMHTLLSKVLEPVLEKHQQQGLEKILLCHSMGGAIGTLFVQTYPRVFTKLILSAPMLGIKTPIGETLTLFIAKTALWFRRLVRLPASYFFGQGNYSPYPFDKNRLTNSEVRYRVFREMMVDYPQNQLGGISFDWLVQAIIGMRKARQNAALILIPTLVFQAQQEQIVDNAKMNEFVEDLPNATLLRVADAQHELLFEQDLARTLVLKEILDFIEKV